MNDFDLIIRARRFAIENHRRVNQLYDGLPYHVHLMEVVDFAHRFEHLLSDDDIDIVICVAWLHDVVEDTGLTYNDIKKVFGERIADLVVNLTTNIHGKTRAERADDNYYERVKSDTLSVFVKIADRLGNTFHSLTYGSSMYNKYNKEFPHFKEMIYNGMYDEMWELLENLEKGEIDPNFYFPKVDMFDEKTIYQIKLPKPIPFGMYDELFRKGIISKKDLKKNTYYRGKCRNATVALWNGFEFVHMRYKFGFRVDEVNHLEDDNEFDLFVPLSIEENPTDEQKIKY